MRIAAYINGFDPESGGGYTFEQDVIEALIQVILQTGANDVCFLVPIDYFDFLSSRLSDTKIEIFPVYESKFSRKFDSILSQSEFLRTIIKRNSKIDCAASKANVNFIWFLSAGHHLTNYPFSTVVWDLQHRSVPWFPEVSSEGVWDRREITHQWFLKRAMSIIVGTSVGKSELERYYAIDEERILILPHPTPSFALDVRVKHINCSNNSDKFKNKNYFIYPAQFWPHKNHINLVRGFSHFLKTSKENCKLVLVGSDKGNRRFVEDEIRRLKLEDNVDIKGFIPREELIELYLNAIALVYPSWCGPENLPPLEAFAIGCPVIAADIAGAREQLGNAALFVSPGSPNEIGEAMQKIFGNQDLRKKYISEGYFRASTWTARNYVNGALESIRSLEPVLSCWGKLSNN